MIDQKSSGKTALHVSCHQGHIDLVKYLINSKANLEIQDGEGDSALHYSCFGFNFTLILKMHLNPF